MKNESLKQRAFHGSLWSFLTQFGDQLLAFVIQVVLARLLTPDDFGTVALLSIFLALSGILSTGGFKVALVQKKDADELDFNSVFYAMLALSASLYLLLFLSAPVISSFYGRPLLTPLLRVLALQLFFSGFNGVQNAYLSRHLMMREGFFISLPTLLVNGMVGIGLALRGLGPWALVGGALSGGAVGTALRWCFIGWRPRFEFSFARLRNLFSFGSRLLLTGLLETFSNQVYGLIIGKWYSPGELAYFNRGDHLPHIVVSSVQGPIGNVAFPVLSQLQSERDAVRRTMRKMLRLMSFLIFPCLFGLAAVAEPLVRLLLTDKWLPAVPFLRVACLGYAFGPVYMLNSQAMNAMGRSDLYLKLEIVKKVLLFLLLFVTIPFGPLVMAGGKAVCLALSAVINTWPNRRLIQYPLHAQFGDVAISALLAWIMGTAVWLVSLLNLPPCFLLFLQLLTGIVVYSAGAFLFRIPGLDELVSFVPASIRKRFNIQ